MSDKDASGQESSDDTECPTCGRDDFASPLGMFQHHSLSHGEQLVERRFWSKVEKRDDDECWEWQAGTRSDGYGMFNMDQEAVRAHRLSYEFEVEDPGDDCVLHHCDNRPCVNPNHLYTGDRTDNARDRDKRDRLPSGESQWMAKLSADDVIEIRRRYDTDAVTQTELGDEYGVHPNTINAIIVGKSWEHI